MIVGRRSLSFGSQYLSENVTSDSDTWPSESHALIISTSICAVEFSVAKTLHQFPRESLAGTNIRSQYQRQERYQCAQLKTGSAERQPPSPARRARLGRAFHRSLHWQWRACLSHLPPNAPSCSRSV